MNLKKTKKTILILTIGILIVFITSILFLISSIFQKQDEKEAINTLFGVLDTPISSNFNTDQIRFSTQRTFTITKNISSVFKVSNSDDFYPSIVLAKRVSKSLNLKRVNKNNNVIIFSNPKNKTTLAFNLQQDSIELNYNYSTPTVNSNFDLTKAERNAVDYLKEIKLWPYDKYKIFYRYLVSTGYQLNEVKGPEDSPNLLGINFSKDFGETTFNKNKPNEGEIEVILDDRGNISKVTYMYRPIETSKVGVYPIANPNERIKDLSQENTMLVYHRYNALKVDPNSISIYNFQLIYYIPSSPSPYLQPVYAFEGIDNNGQTVTILVPAIKEEYLK